MFFFPHISHFSTVAYIFSCNISSFYAYFHVNLSLFFADSRSPTATTRRRFADAGKTQKFIIRVIIKAYL